MKPTKTRLSAPEIRRRICRYVEAVDCRLPSSSGSAQGSGQRGTVDDTKLLKLLQLMQHGNPLRFCSNLESKALVMQAMCRVHEDDTQVCSIGSIVIGGRGRMMSNKQIAWRLGLTEWQCKQLLDKARDHVRLAYKEMA